MEDAAGTLVALVAGFAFVILPLGIIFLVAIVLLGFGFGFWFTTLGYRGCSLGFDLSPLNW